MIETYNNRMKAQYQIQFQSEEQREAFKELLMSMGVAFREVVGAGVEEPEGEYRTAPEDTSEFRAYCLREIQLGIEDVEAGRVVPWEDVERWINQKLEEYEQVEEDV